MLIAGYGAMVLVGFVLGLIGGGGAILTMPILVYLFAIPPVLATSYSLFIVGCASVFGVWRYHVQKLVDYKTAFVFVIPSLLGTYLARRVLLPSVPDIVLETSNFALTKNQLIMIVFAVLMIAASFAMIRPRRFKNKNNSERPARLLVWGFGVGAVAGFVGAGGGFLIIPALVALGGISMRIAVPTSLFIIATNSLIAFGGDLLGGIAMDWLFLCSSTCAAALGLFVGVRLSKFLTPDSLKVGFGWFVLFMGASILIGQL